MFKRETESFRIAEQNNAIRTNHIKARIDKRQQNSKCWLCSDRDEMINHIISECSKLPQKYKTRHDWMGKVSHWEMSKKFKFDHTEKCYLHNLTSVLENDTYKLLWDFDVQVDHLISARRPYIIIINKKKRTCKVVHFRNHRIKLKNVKRRISTWTLQENRKKLRNMKMTIIPIVIGAFGTVTKGLSKRQEDLEVGGRHHY